VGYALGLGVLGGLVGFALLWVITAGGGWYSPARPGWFGGHWWWVAVTGAGGLAVGLVRRLTRLPEQVPGLFEDLRAQYVAPALVPGTVAVSLVSLFGAASLGPEKVLATVAGGAGTWLARRRRLSDEDRAVVALGGIAGVFGGVFSSPVIVVMMILEVVRPGGRRFSATMVATLVASTISFGIYFALAGAVFLGTYRVPAYPFEDWQLLAAVPLGLVAAVVAGATDASVSVARWLLGRLTIPRLATTTAAGVVLGLVGVALPLTMFSGADQLEAVLTGAPGLGLGLCAAILAAKVLTYAISQAAGFVGGPIFPWLFIGGTAGVVVHLAVPALPLGLTFACLLAAVLGTAAAAPFAMVLMTGFLTRAGALQTAPILIAVVTAYLVVHGAAYLRAGRRRSRG